MNKDLAYLVKLQEIDGRISEMESSKTVFPEQVTELEKQIEEARRNVARIEQRIGEVQAEKKALVERTAEAEEALGKSQERLSTIKTNREYDAVHAEIETHKSVVDNSGSNMANLDEELGRLEESLKIAGEDLENTKTENEPKIADLNEKIASIDSRIAQVVKEREGLLPQISKRFQRTYEQIRKRRPSGQILAEVSPDDRTCSVCFKVLESQLFSEVRRGEKLLVCQSCGSILVLDEPQEETEETEEKQHAEEQQSEENVPADSDESSAHQ